MTLMALPEKLTEALKKIEAKVSDFWWIILFAAVVLLIVLFIVIGCKNKRIRKLKRELKNTRTELETERVRAKNAETFAPVTGSEQIFGETPADEAEEEPEKVEIDAEEESAPEEVAPAAQKAPPKQHVQRIAYYDRTTEVTQKGGNVKFIVKYDRAKDSWVIKKEGVDRVVRRVDTKEEAMTIVRELCKKNNASLVVHKKDGKFQRQ